MKKFLLKNLCILRFAVTGLFYLLGVYSSHFFNYNLANLTKNIKVFISILFSVIIFFCLLITKNIYEKSKAERHIAFIPKFSFTTLENTAFTNKMIKKSIKKIIINHFSPACEHCQAMASAFIKDSLKIKNVTILMITNSDISTVVKFRKDYNLSLLSNLILIIDTNYQFQKTFGEGGVPSFYIYQNDKLIKKVIGETNIENLLN